MLRVTFTSSDETKTDVVDDGNHMDIIFPIVKLGGYVILFHK